MGSVVSPFVPGGTADRLDPEALGLGGRQPKVLMVATVAATLRGFLLPYAKRLRDKGWKVDCLASGAATSKPCISGFDRCWEAEWSRNPLGKRGLLFAAKSVRTLVAREGYDIVHVHTPVAAFLTRWALRRRGSNGPKVIYTAHGFHFHKGGGRLRNFVFQSLEKLASRWMDYLVLINGEDHEAAMRMKLAPPDRILRMPGIGVRVSDYAASVDGAHDSVCRELGISPRARLVTMVAEFTPNKRHRDLIRAVSLLGRPDVHVLFAGAGPEQGRCEELAARLGLRDRIHFLGVRSDVGRIIRASLLTVLTSAREGMPRVVMESLCAGVPVVGTRVRGTKDLLGSGAGKLVTVGDVEELAGAIRSLLDRESARRRMGRRGREVIAAYDLERTLALDSILYSCAIRGVPLPPTEVVERLADESVAREAALPVGVIPFVEPNTVVTPSTKVHASESAPRAG